MLRMDEGIWKILIFQKWQMLNFEVFYSTKISLTFSDIKKNNRPKKKMLRLSGGQLYIK